MCARVAIIIENKINDAVHQDKQLALFVTKLLGGFAASEIYVLYLPLHAHKDPHADDLKTLPPEAHYRKITFEPFSDVAGRGYPGGSAYRSSLHYSVVAVSRNISDEGAKVLWRREEQYMRRLAGTAGVDEGLLTLLLSGHEEPKGQNIWYLVMVLKSNSNGYTPLEREAARPDFWLNPDRLKFGSH